MGVARGEVQPWHRAGLAAAPPERSRAISNLFLPPEASTVWVSLPAERRRLSGVRTMETAHPEEEAQAVAVLIRQALAEPERRVALVTPDRALAVRVVAHLARWNIAADDSAGRPLPQTPAGRLFLQIAEVMAERAAPVPLLALLAHPLVMAGEARAAWLERVRQLDLVLRGPRPGPGLEAVRAAVKEQDRRYPGLFDLVGTRRRRCWPRCCCSMAPCRWARRWHCWPKPPKRCAAKASGRSPTGAACRSSCSNGAMRPARWCWRPIPPTCPCCCATRWTKWRCARPMAGIRASRSTACSKRG